MNRPDIWSFLPLVEPLRAHVTRFGLNPTGGYTRTPTPAETAWCGQVKHDGAEPLTLAWCVTKRGQVLVWCGVSGWVPVAQDEDTVRMIVYVLTHAAQSLSAMIDRSLDWREEDEPVVAFFRNRSGGWVLRGPSFGTKWATTIDGALEKLRDILSTSA